MSKVFITSDLHLGHRNICKYRPEFPTMEEHDDFMINKILTLGKRDILIVLGDFLFHGDHYQEYIERLDKKECRIKLVMGNHDSLNLYNEPSVEMQLPLYQKKNIWLSHCPIHPEELRDRLGNVHGHLHKNSLKDSRYFNANIDVNNYEFVDFKDIKGYFNDINTSK